MRHNHSQDTQYVINTSVFRVNTVPQYYVAKFLVTRGKSIFDVSPALRLLLSACCPLVLAFAA